MIIREMREVELLTYSNYDSYGQRGYETQSSIPMVVKVYRQNNVTDVRYANVEMIGLTLSAVDDSNLIRIDGILYDVMYVIPSGRYTQVLMKKHGIN